jgi:hypothetical protein
LTVHWNQAAGIDGLKAGKVQTPKALTLSNVRGPQFKRSPEARNLTTVNSRTELASLTREPTGLWESTIMNWTMGRESRELQARATPSALCCIPV